MKTLADGGTRHQEPKKRGWGQPHWFGSEEVVLRKEAEPDQAERSRLRNREEIPASEGQQELDALEIKSEGPD